jgi:rare lipoprotein A
MNPRLAWLATLVFAAYGCVSTTPPEPTAPSVLQGVASWYGEEFAGRTTANGEIFDPLLLTAAHRTLPFGTVVDVTNPKTKQTVRVRVNDRGPYVGNRIIDLSYAAAQQIGLVEPGIGEVSVNIVQLGKGEREPPAPFSVTVADVAAVPPAAKPAAPAAPPPSIAPQPEAVVDRVDVVVERAGVPVRRQVSADGRTIEEVPVAGAYAAPPPSSPGHSQAEALDRQRTPPPPRVARRAGQFVVQVGAFSVEANAKSLQERLTRIGQRAWIDRDDLWRVRIGPFATRALALEARTTLESNGISAIVMAE